MTIYSLDVLIFLFGTSLLSYIPLSIWISDKWCPGWLCKNTTWLFGWTTLLTAWTAILIKRLKSLPSQIYQWLRSHMAQFIHRIQQDLFLWVIVSSNFYLPLGFAMDTSAISKEAKGNSEHVLRELQKCQAQAIQLGPTQLTGPCQKKQRQHTWLDPSLAFSHCDLHTQIDRAIR